MTFFTTLVRIKPSLLIQDEGEEKNINLFPSMRDYLNDSIPEDENSMSLDENSCQTEHVDNQDDAVDGEILSVSLLNYAMEMPSPSNNPYRDPFFDCEIDLEYGPDFSEAENIDLRKANNIISCTGLASTISSE